MNTDPNDQNRLLIATFIVATTIAVIFSQVALPVGKSSWIVYALGACLWGFIISSFFASSFILAKGYELRYEKDNDNRKTFVDRHNFRLYNIAVKVYVPVLALFSIAIIFDYFKTIAHDSNILGNIGMAFVLLIVVAIVNYKSVKGLFAYIKQMTKDRREFIELKTKN